MCGALAMIRVASSQADAWPTLSLTVFRARPPGWGYRALYLRSYFYWLGQVPAGIEASTAGLGSICQGGGLRACSI